MLSAMVVGHVRALQCSSTDAFAFSRQHCQKCGTIEDMKHGTDSTRGLSLDTVLRMHLAPCRFFAGPLYVFWLGKSGLCVGGAGKHCH